VGWRNEYCAKSLHVKEYSKVNHSAIPVEDHTMEKEYCAYVRLSTYEITLKHII
jgi:hypothetical protein